MLVGENQKLNELHEELIVQNNHLNDELFKLQEDRRLTDDNLRQREDQVDDVMNM